MFNNDRKRIERERNAIWPPPEQLGKKDVNVQQNHAEPEKVSINIELTGTRNIEFERTGEEADLHPVLIPIEEIDPKEVMQKVKDRFKGTRPRRVEILAAILINVLGAAVLDGPGEKLDELMKGRLPEIIDASGIREVYQAWKNERQREMKEMERNDFTKQAVRYKEKGQQIPDLQEFINKANYFETRATKSDVKEAEQNERAVVEKIAQMGNDKTAAADLILDEMGVHEVGQNSSLDLMVIDEPNIRTGNCNARFQAEAAIWSEAFPVDYQEGKMHAQLFAPAMPGDAGHIRLTVDTDVPGEYLVLDYKTSFRENISVWEDLPPTTIEVSQLMLDSYLIGEGELPLPTNSGVESTVRNKYPELFIYPVDASPRSAADLDYLNNKPAAATPVLLAEAENIFNAEQADVDAKFFGFSDVFSLEKSGGLKVDADGVLTVDTGDKMISTGALNYLIGETLNNASNANELNIQTTSTVNNESKKYLLDQFKEYVFRNLANPLKGITVKINGEKFFNTTEVRDAMVFSVADATDPAFTGFASDFKDIWVIEPGAMQAYLDRPDNPLLSMKDFYSQNPNISLQEIRTMALAQDWQRISFRHLRILDTETAKALSGYFIRMIGMDNVLEITPAVADILVKMPLIKISYADMSHDVLVSLVNADISVGLIGRSRVNVSGSSEEAERILIKEDFHLFPVYEIQNDTIIPFRDASAWDIEDLEVFRKKLLNQH